MEARLFCNRRTPTAQVVYQREKYIRPIQICTCVSSGSNKKCPRINRLCLRDEAYQVRQQRCCNTYPVLSFCSLSLHFYIRLTNVTVHSGFHQCTRRFTVLVVLLKRSPCSLLHAQARENNRRDGSHMFKQQVVNMFMSNLCAHTGNSWNASHHYLLCMSF